MNKFLKIEINRVIKSRSFWISLVIGFLIIISQYSTEALGVIKYMDVYKKNGMFMPHNVFSRWIGGEGSSLQHYMFFMIIPLLCTMPWSLSLYGDIKSGIVKHYFSRSEKRNYYLSKYIITFIVGGIVVTIPLLFNLFLTSLTLPSLTPEVSQGLFGVDTNSMWANIFYSHPYIYCFLYINIIFIFSGLTAVSASFSGIWINNGFTILIMPFIINLFLYTIFNTKALIKYVPRFFLDPFQGSSSFSFLIIVMEAMILLLYSILCIRAGIKNDTF